MPVIPKRQTRQGQVAPWMARTMTDIHAMRLILLLELVRIAGMARSSERTKPRSSVSAIACGAMTARVPFWLNA